MSILIKGMAMPERCWDCDLCYDSFYCKGLEVQFSDREDSEPSERRLSDCPLTSVPPHGRCIDADALRQSIKDSIDECHKWAEEVEGGEMYARVSQSLGTFVECSLRVKAAPTIIEAEEEE